MFYARASRLGLRGNSLRGAVGLARVTLDLMPACRGRRADAKMTCLLVSYMLA